MIGTSRLTRSGQEWHQLLALCALSGMRDEMSRVACSKLKRYRTPQRTVAIAIVMLHGAERAVRHRRGRAAVPQRERQPHPALDLPAGLGKVRVRSLALTPAQRATPLMRRPYDLRHSGITWRLNSGVPPTEIAAWAGHSVELLLRVYAKCVAGLEDIWISCMEATLRPPAPRQKTGQQHGSHPARQPAVWLAPWGGGRCRSLRHCSRRPRARCS